MQSSLRCALAVFNEREIIRAGKFHARKRARADPELARTARADI